jgi:hypothetical protein
MDGFTKLTMTWNPGRCERCGRREEEHGTSGGEWHDFAEDVDVCTLNDFEEANDPDEVAIVAALAPGESWTFGGGASTEVCVTVGAS